MFSWRAEMIAARNRAFMLGSGWPILAATVISRASFENSFDFWASCRPLRCMMFLNWECPAMRSLSGFVRDEMGWKARRYRPRPGQNQRFAPDFRSPPRVAPRARPRRNRAPRWRSLPRLDRRMIGRGHGYDADALDVDAAKSRQLAAHPVAGMAAPDRALDTTRVSTK